MSTYELKYICMFYVVFHCHICTLLFILITQIYVSTQCTSKYLIIFIQFVHSAMINVVVLCYKIISKCYKVNLKSLLTGKIFYICIFKKQCIKIFKFTVEKENKHTTSKKGYNLEMV